MTGTPHPCSPPEASAWRSGRIALPAILVVGGRALLVVWILLGLMVCSESLPDVIADFHAHEQSHLMDPWHGSGEETSPVPSPTNHFHCHVIHDFSSAEVDLLGAITPVAPALGVLALVCSKHHSAPDELFFEMLKPPLI